MDWLSNHGSVDDIRCTLSHRVPQTPSEIRADIAWLNVNMTYEITHKNRSTVIGIIRSKIRKLEKQLGDSKAMIGRTSIYK